MIDRSNALELTFVKPGDQFATRGGWLATVEGIEGFRVRGYVDTDYMRTYQYWRQDGTGEYPVEDLVEKLPREPKPARRSFMSQVPGLKRLLRDK